MARYRRVARRPQVVAVNPATASVVVTPETPAPSSLNKADLVSLAQKRGLETSGTKAELLLRLEKS